MGERVAIVPPSTPSAFARELERAFQVKTIRTTIGATEIVGTLSAINSHGVVVADNVEEEEAAALATVGPVAVVRTRQNAIGNNVLANDFGAIVHPELSREAVRKISEALGVPAEPGTVAGLGTVGMTAVATNKGVVVHPKATESETTLIQEMLKVPVARSTANFGVPTVGACVVANTRSLLVGRPTTTVEIVHLQEGLEILS
jgi:translation initiation factor 6